MTRRAAHVRRRVNLVQCPFFSILVVDCGLANGSPGTVSHVKNANGLYVLIDNKDDAVGFEQKVSQRQV
jgi:hypothetical protein